MSKKTEHKKGDERIEREGAEITKKRYVAKRNIEKMEAKGYKIVDEPKHRERLGDLHNVRMSGEVDLVLMEKEG